MKPGDQRIERAAVPPHTTPPVFRYLRGYAFDPTLSIDLDTAAINEVVFPVEWERRHELLPGPVGEYLEVIDYDPASGRLYAPVDLNHPYVLAQNGLAPSESSPQFHQQMVYAVAMTTIANFERALGRKVLWAPRLDERGFEPAQSYVQRLRIYPHALRQANAYYSPAKKALLFGYFPAAPAQLGEHLPGGTVFTCLSHDIIAHETTHALLDGMHRRFIEPTNPDVRAFHEAFADIVALFQHFSFPAALRHQIAGTRGDLAAENYLGQIAQQFGSTNGGHGALRDAIGKVNPATGKWEPLKPDPQALEKVLTPHERGAILVAAVFDAFLTIYKSRVADLLRIATGGTGVLPAGALHPDLVNRMADEAAKAARHVLQVCIRALDYLAPVDVTFGDYLRALITADYDAVPFDDRSYRLAFIEAFRRRGIYPRDVRSLAQESLRWRELTIAEDDAPAAESAATVSRTVARKLAELGHELLQSFLTRPTPKPAPGDEGAEPVGYAQDGFEEGWDPKDRETIFYETKALRRWLNTELNKRFSDAEGEELYRLTGLIITPGHSRFEGKQGLALKRSFLFKGVDREVDPTTLSAARLRKLRPRFDVHVLRLAERVTPDGKLLRQYIIGLIQTRRNGFRGGCTLIIDADTYRLRYAIKKSVLSATRERRQRGFAAYVAGGSAYNTYFNQSQPAEPFALLHSAYRQS